MEHCDMKNGKCMDCDWVSGKLTGCRHFRFILLGFNLFSVDLMKEKETNPSPELFGKVFADVGRHLNENHMIKAEMPIRLKKRGERRLLRLP